MFRFGVMGAGNIARKFCEAVTLIEDCKVVAVASKSRERAFSFAMEHGINSAYGDYTVMLEQEKPDAVYIAVLPMDHAKLIELCLIHHTPVLCEKTIYRNSEEAIHYANFQKIIIHFLWKLCGVDSYPQLQRQKNG
jgi:predicted dehydrogenase